MKEWVLLGKQKQNIVKKSLPSFSLHFSSQLSPKSWQQKGQHFLDFFFLNITKPKFQEQIIVLHPHFFFCFSFHTSPKSLLHDYFISCSYLSFSFSLPIYHYSLSLVSSYLLLLLSQSSRPARTMPDFAWEILLLLLFSGWILVFPMGVVTVAELKPSISGKRSFRPSSSARHVNEW